MSTTAVIGGITFEIFKGLIQPEGPELKENPTLGLSGTNVKAQGRVTTYEYVETEAEAITIAKNAGALVDTSVTVTLGGYTLPTDVFVRQAKIRHRKIRGQISNPAADLKPWEVKVIWDFGDNNSIGGGGSGSVKETLLHVKVFTGNDITALVEQTELRVRNARDGYGKQLGAASLVMDIEPGQAPLEVVGQYVRLDFPNPPVDNPGSWTARWQGRIYERTVDPANLDEGQAYATYSAVQTDWELNGPIVNWSEVQPDGVTLADSVEWLGANILPAGDKHTAQIAGKDVSSRVGGVGNRAPWRDREYLQASIDQLALENASDLVFSLGGQFNDALANQGQYRPNGGTVLDVLAQAQQAGIGWRVTGTGAAKTLEFRTPVSAAITLDDYFIPANDKQTALDLTDPDIPYGTWSWRDDQMPTKDIVYVIGGRPLYAATLGFRGDDSLQLQKDWTPGEEAAWKAAKPDERDRVELAHVFRRFKLRDDWEGGTYFVPLNQLETFRETSDDATFGKDGENGEFGAGGGPSFSFRSINFEKALPMNNGKSYSSVTSEDKLDWNSSLEKVLAFVVLDPTGTPKWVPFEISVQVDSDNPRILFGRNAREAVKVIEAIDAGADIVLTVGFRFPKKWRMSWRRDPVNWPAITARVVAYEFPELSYEFVLDQTVVGIADGAPVKTDEGIVGGDVPPGLNQRLGLARLVHELPQSALTWRLNLDLDVGNTYVPGALITDVTVPAGVGVVNGVDALLVSKEWDFGVGDYGTTFRAQRQFPGLRPSVQHPSVPTNEAFFQELYTSQQ